MRLVTMIIFAFVIFVGCNADYDIRDAQIILQKPDSIVLRYEDDDTKIIYEPESEKYNAIFNAIEQNWFKYVVSEEIFANDDELIYANSQEDLKTTTDVRYNSPSDMVLIDFEFKNNSMVWPDFGDNEKEINIIRFVLPKTLEQDKNTKSFFQIMGTYENEQLFLEGVYLYYYNNELFHILSDIGRKVSSVIHENEININLSFYSNITTDEMKNAFITKNGWTRLEDHQVYWNSNLNQIVINHIFSGETAEVQLETAGDYMKTIDLYRNYPRPDSKTAALWRRIPQNAEVVIQVYREELFSQDMYKDIEKNIIYTHESYHKK